MGDAGEIAKASSPLIENLAKLTGPLCDEMGQYFGDKARAFRQRNITTIVEASFKRLDDVGKPVSPVPPRLLIPIMEAASVEDNPTLQDMWSGLLASASDQADDMSPSYAETLKALTPMEARSLNTLYEAVWDSPGCALGDGAEFEDLLTFRLGLSPGESFAPGLIRETLERLGIIYRQYQIHDSNPLSRLGYTPDYLQSFLQPSNQPSYLPPSLGRSDKPIPELIFQFAFTSYGIQFMRACRGPMAGCNDQLT